MHAEVFAQCSNMEKQDDGSFPQRRQKPLLSVYRQSPFLPSPSGVKPSKGPKRRSH